MADCVAIQQECIVAGRATRAKIVSQYKGDCIVTGCSWALGVAGTRRGRWAGVRGRAGRRAGGKRRQERGSRLGREGRAGSSSARAWSAQAGQR